MMVPAGTLWTFSYTVRLSVMKPNSRNSAIEPASIPPANPLEATARTVDAKATLVPSDVHQRLHAQPVANQDQLCRAVVPDADGEHTAQLGHQTIDALGI